MFWACMCNALMKIQPLVPVMKFMFTPLDRCITLLQTARGTFNKAMVMNIGFVEIMKQHKYDCLIFNDVDLLPEDDRNLYTCPLTPRHMSVAVDTLEYK